MTDDRRIAILTPYAADDSIGGVEVFNEHLRAALGDVQIFADRPRDGRRADGHFRRVGLEQPMAALRAARTLLRRHREEPFDLIISNGVSGWPLTLAGTGVPMVQVYHFTMAGLARTALSLPGDRVTVGHVTARFDRLAGMGKSIVAVSSRVLHEVESMYHLKGRFIPNAVDTAVFRPMDAAQARESLGLPTESPIGLFVGRPDPPKGYDTLLQVARKMPDVLFVVAGGPPGATGNVRSLGMVPHDDMPRVYAAADFFFLPSRYEGFSLSLLEALACDLPAVVTNAANPFPDSPSDWGVVVADGHEDEFVRAIRSVLTASEPFASRAFVLPRHGIRGFQRSWQGFVESVIESVARPPSGMSSAGILSA